MNYYAALSGYLVISLCGDNPERIINMAMSRGIYLWDIEQYDDNCFRLKIRLGGYKAVRHLVRRSSCRIRILEKRGLPFWAMRAKRRKVLVLGTIFFCAALYFMSSFVWTVEVHGNESIPAGEILNKAAYFGLKPGVPVSGVNKEELKNQLINNMPELAWVGIQVQGTKVIIEVAEKTFPPKDNQRSNDLVARCAGKIEELLVLQGTPLVKEGDEVEKGQILIAGVYHPQIEIRPDGTIVPRGEPQKKQALGLVRARVIHQQVGQCGIVEETDRDTGAQTTVTAVKFKDREITLQGPRNIPYDRYRRMSQVKSYSWGRNPAYTVEIITSIYFEQVHESKNWGIQGAYREALRRAREKVWQEVPREARVISERDEPVSSAEKGAVGARYVLESLEDIGE